MSTAISADAGKAPEEVALEAAWQAAEDNGDMAAKKKWYSEAQRYLYMPENKAHWWCQHTAVVQALAGDVLPYHDQQPVVQQLWRAMSEQLAECTLCIQCYHAAQDAFRRHYVPEASQQLLQLLARLDAARLSAALSAPIPAPPAQLPSPLLNALVEALTYPYLLEDAGLCGALVAALRTLAATHDLDLSGGERFPGLYVLMAHRDADVRLRALTEVKKMGSIDGWQQFVEDGLLGVVEAWTNVLAEPHQAGQPQQQQEQQQRQEQGHEQQQAAKGNGRMVWLHQHVWAALRTMLGLMKGDALVGLANALPALPQFVASRCLQLPAPGNHAPSPEFRNAVGCLNELLLGLGGSLWQYVAQSPAELSQALAGACWRVLGDQATLKVLLQALEGLAIALLPQGDAQGADVLPVLHHLLVMLPGSACPPLLQSMGVEAGLRVCLQAMQLGYPSSFAADLWGPPACELLSGASAHAGPLQARLVQQAAVLMGTVLQMDASVLFALLAGSSGCEELCTCPLVPGADLAAELAVDSCEHYSCSPALWCALTNCTHPNVATLLLVAAAHLSAVNAEQGRDAGVGGGFSGGAGHGAMSGAGFYPAATEVHSQLAAALQAFQGSKQQQQQQQQLGASAHAVSAREVPRWLLAQLRGAADAFLQRCSALPIVQIDHTSDCGGAEEQLQVLPLYSCCLLVMAAGPTSRATAKRALQAHYHAASWDEAVQAGMLSDEASAVAVLDALQHVLQQLSRLPPAQVLLSQRAQPFLQLATTVLSGAEPQGEVWLPLVAPLSAGVWELLAAVLHAHSPSDLQRLAAAAAALQPLLQLLPVTRRYQQLLLQQERAMRTAAGDADATEQPSPAEQLLWLVQLLGWGQALAAAAPALLQAWLGALSGVMQALPQPRQLPDQVLAAAKQLLQGNQLPDAARLQVARLLPEAAPGTLAQGEGLGAWPSRAAKQQPAAVVDLSAEDTDASLTAKAKPQHQQQQGGRASKATSPGKGSKQSTLFDAFGRLDVLPKPPAAAGSSALAEQLASSHHASTSSAAGTHGDAGHASHHTAPGHGHQHQQEGQPARQGGFKIPSKRRHVQQQQQRQAGSHLLSSAAPFHNSTHNQASSRAGIASGNGWQQHDVDGLWPQEWPGSGSGSGARHHAAKQAAPQRQPGTNSRASQIKADLLGGERGRTMAPAAARRPLPVTVPEHGAAAAAAKGARTPSPRPWQPALPQQQQQQQQHQPYHQQHQHPNARQQPERRSTSPAPIALINDADLFAPTAANHNGQQNAEQLPPPGRTRLVLPSAAPARHQTRIISADGRDESASALAAPTGFSVLRRGANSRVQDRALLPHQQRHHPQAPEPPPLKMEAVRGEVLSWDYRDVVQGGGGHRLAGLKVPLAFRSTGQYADVFRRLLVEELRTKIRSEHEELVGGSAITCLPLTIASVQRQSEVHRLSVQLDTSAKDGRAPDAGRPDDLLLLTTRPIASPTELTRALNHSRLLALVLDANNERQPGSRSVELEVCVASAGAQVMQQHWEKHLVPRCQLFATLITSLVPEFREFQALCSFRTLPDRLKSQILAPLPSVANRHQASLGAAPLTEPLKQSLAAAFNASQQSAIASCLDCKVQPFSLVQGPPGTGKTSAIVGIISALLAAGRADKGGKAQAPSKLLPRKRPQPGTNSSTAAGEPANDDEAVLKLGQVPPARVLVCAQSNAAIDELVSRLAADGVWGPDGQRRRVAMVRMGRSEATHPTVLSYHVDAIADDNVSVHARSADATSRTEAARERARELAEQLEELDGKLAELERQLEQQRLGQHGQGQSDTDQQKQAEGWGGTGAIDGGGDGRSSRSPDLPNADSRRQHSSRVHSRERIDSRARSGERNDRRARSRERNDSRAHSRERSNSRERRSRRQRSREGSRTSSRDRSREGGSRHNTSRNRSKSRARSRARYDHPSRDCRHGSADQRTSASPSRKRKGSRSRSPVSRSDHRHSSRPPSRSSSPAKGPNVPAGAAAGALASSREPSPSALRSPSPGPAAGAAAPGAAAGGAAAGEAAALAVMQLPMDQRLELMRDRRRKLRRELDTCRAEHRRGGRELDRAKRDLRQAVVRASEVVLCTLSAAGGDVSALLKSAANSIDPNSSCSAACQLFDALVIDEAAQALEPATLVPLALLRPEPLPRIVLVGDPRQLPPTVLSKAAEEARLAQSLFERLQKGGWPVTMLTEQYRMHPAISCFPSAFFYQGQLTDGAGISAASRAAPFHKQPALGPLVVWDCAEGREGRGGGAGGRRARGSSLQNVAEAQLACALYTSLVRNFPGAAGSVAVITPYRAQVGCLRAEFRRAHGEAALEAAGVEFATVDAFQGREADVVIFSCVRAHADSAAAAANGTKGVGFLADVRRMNVGLTRARRSLWVVCHVNTLAGSSVWRPLLQDVGERGVLFSGAPPLAQLWRRSKEQLAQHAPALPAA